MNKDNIKFLLFAFFNNLGIGSYMVLVAWTAATLNHGVGAVGRVFMVASLVSVFLGPFIGNYVDNHERKRVLYFSQIIKLSVSLFPSISILLIGPISQYVLYVIVAFISLSSSLSAISIDYLIRESFDENGVKNTVSSMSVFREVGVFSGSILGGFLIYYLSFEYSFLILLFFSFSTTLIFIFFMPNSNNESINKNQRASLFSHIIQFNVLIKDISAGRFVIIIVMTGLGAFMNTLLPQYISELSYGTSKLYGIVEAFWSLGGVFAGALIIKIPSRILTSDFNPSVLLVGILTILIPFAFNGFLIVAIHFLIGMFFSFGFISAQSYFIQNAQNGTLGKHLSIANSFGSVLALLVYFLPSVVSYSSISAAYFWGGGLIGLIGFFVILLPVFNKKILTINRL